MPSSKITHRAKPKGKDDPATLRPGSWKWQKAVWKVIGDIDREFLSRTEEHVLLRVMHHVNGEVGTAYVGLREIARQARLGRFESDAAMQSLVEKGVIVLLPATRGQEQHRAVDLRKLLELAAASVQHRAVKVKTHKWPGQAGPVSGPESTGHSEEISGPESPGQFQADLERGVARKIASEWPGKRPLSGPESPGPNVERRNGGHFLDGGQREAFSSSKKMFSPSATPSCLPDGSGAAPAARKGSGETPTATSNPEPTVSNPCSSPPPVDAGAADDWSTAMKAYIRRLVARSPNWTRDDVVEELCRKFVPVIEAELLSPADIGAVATEVLAEFGR